MNRKICWSVAASLLAFAAYAADQPLTGDEIRTVFTGKSFNSSGGILTWKADGSYEYFSKGNGTTYRGKYDISDGKICVKFTTGDSRCDRFVRDGDKLTLINSKGERFPLKAR